MIAMHLEGVGAADLLEAPGLLESLGVAVYTTDVQGRLTAYNEAAVTLWGWRPQLGEARWCGSWRLFHPDGTPLAHEACPMAMVLQEGRPIRGMEAIAERPDGTRVPFIPYPTPLRDEAGGLTGAINVLVDITDRTIAEAALAGSAAWLRAVFETTPECIKLVAPDGTLLQMNAAGLRMLDAKSAADVEGRSMLDLVVPQHRAIWKANHDRVCAGEILRWEYDLIGLGGRRLSMETNATPLPMPDGRLAQLAITRDITERRRAQEHQALLMREVDHRAKNVLAVALSLVRLTRNEDPDHYAEVLEGRIAALANAHGLLAEEDGKGADLRAVLQAELAPYLEAGGVTLHGPPVGLTPGTVQPVSMVLHELVTNAAKYGALSVPAGRLTVVWEVDAGRGDLELNWVERGGPAVAGQPVRRGFGTKLIEGMVQGQLGGSIEQHWEPTGLRGTLMLGADRLQPRGGEIPDQQATVKSVPTAGSLAGRRVLLLEDELLVAMVMEETLRDLGCEVVGPVTTVEAAQRLVQAEAGRIDAAVLDINLSGRPSFPVADILAGQGVPVVFATGYGDLPDGRAVGKACVLLRKPIRRAELEATLLRLLPSPSPTLPGTADRGQAELPAARTAG